MSTQPLTNSNSNSTDCSSCSCHKPTTESTSTSSLAAIVNTNTTGYSSPLDAFHHGPREKIVYVTAISTQPQDHPDAIITVDVDPQSKTYSQIIHILSMPYKGDELHHFGKFPFIEIRGLGRGSRSC